MRKGRDVPGAQDGLEKGDLTRAESGERQQGVREGCTEGQSEGGDDEDSLCNTHWTTALSRAKKS